MKKQIAERFLTERTFKFDKVKPASLAATDKHIAENLVVYKNINKAINGEPSAQELFTYYSARLFCRALYQVA